LKIKNNFFQVIFTFNSPWFPTSSKLCNLLTNCRALYVKALTYLQFFSFCRKDPGNRFTIALISSFSLGLSFSAWAALPQQAVQSGRARRHLTAIRAFLIPRGHKSCKQPKGFHKVHAFRDWNLRGRVCCGWRFLPAAESEDLLKCRIYREIGPHIGGLMNIIKWVT